MIKLLLLFVQLISMVHWSNCFNQMNYKSIKSKIIMKSTSLNNIDIFQLSIGVAISAIIIFGNPLYSNAITQEEMDHIETIETKLNKIQYKLENTEIFDEKLNNEIGIEFKDIRNEMRSSYFTLKDDMKTLTFENRFFSGLITLFSTLTSTLTYVRLKEQDVKDKKKLELQILKDIESESNTIQNDIKKILKYVGIILK